MRATAMPCIGAHPPWIGPQERPGCLGTQESELRRSTHSTSVPPLVWSAVDPRSCVRHPRACRARREKWVGHGSLGEDGTLIIEEPERAWPSRVSRPPPSLAKRLGLLAEDECAAQAKGTKRVRTVDRRRNGPHSEQGPSSILVFGKKLVVRIHARSGLFAPHEKALPAWILTRNELPHKVVATKVAGPGHDWRWCQIWVVSRAVPQVGPTCAWPKGVVCRAVSAVGRSV